MQKILIFGNSGSGKSTLAKHLCEQHGLAHLDLDTLAWLPTSPPRRAPLQDSAQTINTFIQNNAQWVIEGCYSDLLELASASSTELIFLNLPIEQCISNAKQRPWEPHKYPSKEAQDANLAMLLEWIAQYQERKDEFSYSAHLAFYSGYSGNKRMISKTQPL